jgi:hypothetical protein
MFPQLFSYVSAFPENSEYKYHHLIPPSKNTSSLHVHFCSWRPLKLVISHTSKPKVDKNFLLGAKWGYFKVIMSHTTSWEIFCGLKIPKQLQITCTVWPYFTDMI